VHGVQVLRERGATVVSARGEVDAYVAPALADAFASQAKTSGGIVVDLASVSFMDSTALGAVVRAVRELGEAGRPVRVVLPRGSARRVFELTTVDRLLPIAASRAQAVSELVGS
jgi:anti-sigma B factor antagonist